MSRNIWISFCLFTFISPSFALIQNKEIILKPTLIKKIQQMKPDSSNAHALELLLGPPAACVPVNATSQESWVCQWKTTLTSNSMRNTLNVFFEAGAISQIRVIKD